MRPNLKVPGLAKRQKAEKSRPEEKPAKDDLDDRIEYINRLIAVAKVNWFGLIGYLAFAGITLLAVQDADFFVASRRTQLPVVNIEIPTKEFFLFAPIVGAVLTVYLHFYLIKIWDGFARLGPQQDVRAIEEKLTPWLINDLALLLRKGWRKSSGLSRLTSSVSFVVCYVFPVWFLYAIWIRFFPAHDTWISLTGGVFFVAGASMVVGSFFAMGRIRWLLWWLRILRYFPIRRFTARNIVGFACLLSLVVFFVTLFSTYISFKIFTWNSITSAQLSEAELVKKPADWKDYDSHMRQFRIGWCTAKGIAPSACGPSPWDNRPALPGFEQARLEWCEKTPGIGKDKCKSDFDIFDKRFIEDWKQESKAYANSMENLNLKGEDLRFANLESVYLVGADLREAQMQGANLERAEMQGAKLQGAEMQGADLEDAQMQGADLEDAQMQSADLEDAQMQGADLEDAQMQGAYLQDTKLQDANLKWAEMQGANLKWANMQGANLQSAEMQDADLLGAEMQGANLTRANMRGVNLAWAKMGGANLSGAEMQGAELYKAEMKSIKWATVTIDTVAAHLTDFSGADGLSQEHVTNMIGNEETILPMPSNGEQPFAIASCWEKEPKHIDLLLANFPDHKNKNGVSFRDRVRASLLCSEKNKFQCFVRRSKFVLEEQSRTFFQNFRGEMQRTLKVADPEICRGYIRQYNVYGDKE